MDDINWKRANVAMNVSISRRISMRDARIMSGSDMVMTTHA